MLGVKNTSDQDITLRYDDKPYTFPAGKTVKVDSESVARFFVEMTYLPPSPKSGRPAAVNPLCLAPVPEEAEADLTFIPEKEPEPPQPVCPPASDKQPEVPEDIKAMRLRKDLAKLPRDRLVELCRARGVFKKHMDVTQMADRLAAIGETGKVPL
jgi:hypothetical protein